MRTSTFVCQRFIIGIVLILFLFQSCTNATFCNIFPDSERCQDQIDATTSAIVKDEYIPISIQLFDADIENLRNIPQPQNINVRIHDPAKQLITASGIPITNYRDSSNVLPADEGIVHTQSGIINLRLPKKTIAPLSGGTKPQVYTFTLNVSEGNYFEVTKSIHIASEQPIYKVIHMLQRRRKPIEVGTHDDVFSYDIEQAFTEKLSGIASTSNETDSSMNASVLSAGLEIEKGIVITQSIPIIKIPEGGFDPINSPFSGLDLDPKIPKPDDFYKGIVFPKDIKFSSGIRLPDGVKLAEGTSLPARTQLPENIVLPRGTSLKKGTFIPKNAVLPYGIDLPLGKTLEQDVVLTENQNFLFSKKSRYSTIQNRSAEMGIFRISVFDTRNPSKNKEDYPINFNILPKFYSVTNAIKGEEIISTPQKPLLWEVLTYVDYDLIFDHKRVKELSSPAKGFVEIEKKNSTVKKGDQVEIWSQDSKTGQWKFEQDASVEEQEGTYRIEFGVKHFSRYTVVADGRFPACSVDVNLTLDNVGAPGRNRYIRMESPTNGPIITGLWNQSNRGSDNDMLNIHEDSTFTISFEDVPDISGIEFQILEGTLPDDAMLVDKEFDCNNPNISLQIPPQNGMLCERIDVKFICGSTGRVYGLSGVALNYQEDNTDISGHVGFFDREEPVFLGLVGLNVNDRFILRTYIDNTIEIAFRTKIKTLTPATDNTLVLDDNITMTSINNFGFNSILVRRAKVDGASEKDNLCNTVTTFEFTVDDDGCEVLNAIEDNEGGVFIL